MAFNANDAVAVGMIQKLIMPDVSDEWIEELVVDEFGPNFDERDTSFVKIRILVNLNSHAITLANNLEDENTRKTWVEKVKNNGDHLSSVMRDRRAGINASTSSKLPAWHDDMMNYYSH